MVEGENIEVLKEGARKTSIKEGCYSSFASGVGDNFIVPFAKELLARPIEIGLLSAFPNLLSPLAQMFGSRLMEGRSRKSIVVNFVLLHALFYLPIAFLGILAYLGYFKGSLSLLLVFGYSMLAVVGGIAGPAWFSWMGDIVNDRERGKYFSRRNKIAGVIGMFGFLLGALILDFMKTKGVVLIGFSILYLLAFSFRIVSYKFFQKQYEPEFRIEKKDYYFSFWAFLKRYGNFVKFSVYMGVFHVAMTIAGPFFAVYMLKELNFSYLTYMMVSLSGTIFYLFLAPYAGKISDKYGNLMLIRFSSGVLALFPLLWIFFKNPIHLIFINQFVGGIATAAFAIGTTNFIYDTVTPARRGICVAYMNILVGVGVFIGALLGGFILSNFHPSWINSFFFLFCFSALLRAVVVFVFVPQIKEIKSFDKMPPVLDLVSVGATSLFKDSFVLIRSIPNKLLFRKEIQMEVCDINNGKEKNTKNS